MVRCASRKSENTCGVDGLCSWNGTSCENDSYSKFLQICKSNKGKAALVEFAQKIGVNTAGMTIPKLCLLVTNQLQTLEAQQNLQARVLFNNIISGHNPAPIVPDDIIHPVSIPAYSAARGSSSASIERLLEFPMGNRVRFHKHVSMAMNKTSNTDVCTFQNGLNKIRRIGTPSINGEAHIVTTQYRSHTLVLAMKKMPNLKKNLKEIKLYEHFTKSVLDGVNPHFPIIYRSVECKNCTYENGDMMRRIGKKRVDCIVCFNELANGDLQSVLTTPGAQFDYNDLGSFWCQLAIAGFEMEKAGIAHNDLHWGNILYHKILDNDGKYTHYKIYGHDVYVLSTGYHWVLWDLGETIKASKSKSVKIDMFRISNIYKWMRYIRSNIGLFTPEMNTLCYELAKFTQLTNNMNYFKFLQKIHEILDPSKNILMIDPPIKPNKIINRIVYNVC